MIRSVLTKAPRHKVVAAAAIALAIGATSVPAYAAVSSTASTKLVYNADGVAASGLKLSRKNVKVGQDVTATVTIHTKRSITFREMAVSMRDSRKIDGPDLDFAHDQNLTVNGSKVLRHARSQSRIDTYKVDIAYTLDGKKWTRLTAPTTSYKVSKTGSATPTTEKPAATSTTKKPTSTSTTKKPAITSTTKKPPTSTPAGIKPAIPGNWTLAFSDEFNGTSLDTTKWIMCNPSFASSCKPWNEEQQVYRTTKNNANVKVSGGQLHLVATKENGQIYSGMVSTGPDKFGYNNPGYKSFQFTYGYYEGRVRIPKGNGFWPSMWMLPDQDKNGAWPGSGEYDVFEIPGNDPTEYHFTAHWAGGGVCGHACTPQEAHIADASAGFHTFGLDWQPSGLTWYVDGKKMGKTITDAGAIKKTPFYIIANFSVGGTWGPLNGGPDGSTKFPASFDIDYLRVWKKA